MSRKKIIVQALIVIAGLFLVASSNAWAVPCLADTNCDGKVNLADLVQMKIEFNETNCDPCGSGNDLPDLIIQDISIDPIQPRPGELINIEVTVKNQGQVSAQGFYIDWYHHLDTPPLIGQFGDMADRVAYLGAGATYTMSTDYTYSSIGEYNMYAQVDADALIEESLEDNNILGPQGIYVAYPSPVPKTGQTTSYATGDDGDLEKGVPWPTPRFTDNGDGTVTDNLTGLVWLKNANCFGLRSWNSALSDSNGLENGECGLTDGSGPGDWRLPNRFELESLLDLENAFPALPTGHPFTNVQSWSAYWSSTTHAYDIGSAWFVDIDVGAADYGNTSYGVLHCWPVRGGQ